MPRGTGAKLIENPRPPVPRPTRSSKLSRTAELTDEFVRGGGTASVPTFSWLIAPVPRMVAPVLVRRTMSPSSWETPNKLAEPRASPSSMDMATPACRAGGAAQMTSPSLLRLAVLELSAPNAHLAATHPAGSGSVTMEPPCAGPARGASPVAARVRDSDPTNIVPGTSPSTHHHEPGGCAKSAALANAATRWFDPSSNSRLKSEACWRRSTGRAVHWYFVQRGTWTSVRESRSSRRCSQYS